MKKKVLISALCILIILFGSVIILHKIFNKEKHFDTTNKTATTKIKDMILIEELEKKEVIYKTLKLSDISYKNEDGKTKLSLKAKNISNNNYGKDRIKVEIYDDNNDLIGVMILVIAEEIEPNKEISLSLETESEFKDSYAVKIRELNDEEQQNTSATELKEATSKVEAKE